VTQLTNDSTPEIQPTFSPDGKRSAFGDRSFGKTNFEH